MTYAGPYRDELVLYREQNRKLKNENVQLQTELEHVRKTGLTRYQTGIITAAVIVGVTCITFQIGLLILMFLMLGGW